MAKNALGITNYWKHRIDPETGIKYKPEALVLHITDSTGESALRWFQDPRSYASSHYLITESGKVLSLVEECHAAWANGRVVRPTWKGLKIGVNPNLYTISVEVANQGNPPSWNQWVAWVKLCKDIANRNNFDLGNDLQIVNHNEIHGSKTCPAPWFTKFYLRILARFI